jgi:autocrine motility factor receptor
VTLLHGAGVLLLLRAASPFATPAEVLDSVVDPSSRTRDAALLLGANALLSASLVTTVIARRLFLGRLTAQESLNASESAAAFLAFKAVLVVALLQEPEPGSVAALALLSFVVACARSGLQLGKERFSSLINAPRRVKLAEHLRTASLSALLLLFLLVLCRELFLATTGDWLLRLLLLHDPVLLLFTSCSNCLAYAVYAYDSQVGADSPAEWRRSLEYSAETLCATCIDASCLVHAAAVYWMHGLGISIVDIIILLYCRAVGLSLWQRLHRYTDFVRVSRQLYRCFGEVPAEELKSLSDNCAVCRESLESGRRLPCGHVLHGACLLRWMEVRCECPTCRAPLGRLR